MKLLRGIVAGFALACSVSAFAQTNQGTSPLTGPKGGTNNAFMQFAGPATSLKTYTLPNATGTIALLGQIQTWSAAQAFTTLTATSLALGGASIGSNSLAVTGTTLLGNTAIQTASASGFSVGLNNSTNPAFNVDASTALQAAGLNVKGAATGGTVAVSAIDSGAATNLTIDAKGTGTIGFGTVSTGSITLARPTTLSGALTYGGVTLNNAVTGTGNMVLSSAPTLTLNNATGLPVSTGLSGLGTGVATALGTAVGATGGPVVFNGSIGTPSAGVLTNVTGLPISTGVSGLGTGVAGTLANGINTNNGFPVYVAGGWTPTITTSGTVGTPAYTVQLGTYEIIGRQATARFTIVLSGWTGSPTGNVLVGGLPIASGGVANDNGQCHMEFYSVVGLAASNVGISGIISAATPSTITLLQASNTGTTPPTAAQIGTTPTLSGICNYHI